MDATMVYSLILAVTLVVFLILFIVIVCFCFRESASTSGDSTMSTATVNTRKQSMPATSQVPYPEDHPYRGGERPIIVYPAVVQQAAGSSAASPTTPGPMSATPGRIDVSNVKSSGYGQKRSVGFDLRPVDGDGEVELIGFKALAEDRGGRVTEVEEGGEDVGRCENETVGMMNVGFEMETHGDGCHGNESHVVNIAKYQVVPEPANVEPATGKVAIETANEKTTTGDVPIDLANEKIASDDSSNENPGTGDMLIASAIGKTASDDMAMESTNEEPASGDVAVDSANETAGSDCQDQVVIVSHTIC